MLLHFVFILNPYLQTCYIISFYLIVVRGNSDCGKNRSRRQVYIFLIAYLQKQIWVWFRCVSFFRTVLTHVDIGRGKLWQSQKWSVLPLTTICMFKKISTICIYVNMNVCSCVLVYMYVCVSVCMYMYVCVCLFCKCKYICVMYWYEYICYILIVWFKSYSNI